MEDDNPTEYTALLETPPEPQREVDTPQRNATFMKKNDKTKILPQSNSDIASGSIEISTDTGQYVTQSSNTINEIQIPRHLRTTNLQSLMHLLKGNIGTGVLAMPIAVSYAGLWVGSVGILFLGGLATHCMHMLLNCSHRLRERTNCGPLGYASILEKALETGPKFIQKYSKVGKGIVNGFLVFTQFGFCCVYILFVAQNVKQVVHSFHENDPSIEIYLIITAALLIPYCFVRNLVYLAPFSSFANLLHFVGLIVIFQYVVRDLPDQSIRPAYKSFDKLPLYMGTALFTYEGIGLVMPIENKMKTPQDFRGINGVLNLGMVIICCLYTAMGWYGYVKFGDDAKGSVTLNLPTDELLYRLINLMFAVSLFISYGLQLYVPVNIIYPKIEKFLISKRKKLFGELAFRVFLIGCTAGIAMVVPHLDLLISLIGAFASSSLALMVPPIIEIVTFSAEGEKLSPVTVVKNSLIILLGLVGFGTGTYSTMKEIVDTFRTTSQNQTYPFHNITVSLQ